MRFKLFLSSFLLVLYLFAPAVRAMGQENEDHPKKSIIGSIKKIIKKRNSANVISQVTEESKPISLYFSRKEEKDIDDDNYNGGPGKNIVLKEEEKKEKTTETSKIIIAGKEIPVHLIARILRFCEKPSYNNAWKYGEIWQARRLSKSWKVAADKVILEDQLLCIFLSPTNYKAMFDPERTESLKRIASLAWQISFIKWTKSFDNLCEALTICPFPNLQVLSYHQSTNYPPDFANTLHLGSKGAQILSQVFPNFLMLQILDISSEIEGEGAVSLCTALSKLSHLKTILISSLKGHEGVIAFFDAIKHLHKLEEVQLATNIGKESGISISKALQFFSPTLTRLSLQSTHMGPKAIVEFANNFPYISHLKRLILEDSEPGDEGAKKVAENLPSLPLLEILNLGREEKDQWGDEGRLHYSGAQALLKAVKHSNIKILWLQNYGLDKLGVDQNISNKNGEKVKIIVKNIYPWNIRGDYEDYAY